MNHPDSQAPSSKDLESRDLGLGPRLSIPTGTSHNRMQEKYTHNIGQIPSLSLSFFFFLLHLLSFNFFKVSQTLKSRGCRIPCTHFWQPLFSHIPEQKELRLEGISMSNYY